MFSSASFVLLLLFLSLSILLLSSIPEVANAQLDYYWPRSSDLPLQPDPETNTVTVPNVDASTLYFTEFFPKENISVTFSGGFIGNVIFPTSFNFYLKNMSLKFVNAQVRIYGFTNTARETSDYDPVNTITLLENSSIEFHSCLVMPDPNRARYTNDERKSIQGLQIILNPSSKGWSFIFNRSIYRWTTTNMSNTVTNVYYPDSGRTAPLGIYLDWLVGTESEFSSSHDEVENEHFYVGKFGSIQVVDSRFESNHGPVRFFGVDIGNRADRTDQWLDWQKRILAHGRLLNVSGNTVRVTQHEGYWSNESNPAFANRGCLLLGPSMHENIQLTQGIFMDGNDLDWRNVIAQHAIFKFMTVGYAEFASYLDGCTERCKGLTIPMLILFTPRISFSNNILRFYSIYTYVNRHGATGFAPVSLAGLTFVGDVVLEGNELYTTCTRAKPFEVKLGGYATSQKHEPFTPFDPATGKPSLRTANKVIFQNNIFVSSDGPHVDGALFIKTSAVTRGYELILINNNTVTVTSNPWTILEESGGGRFNKNKNNVSMFYHYRQPVLLEYDEDFSMGMYVGFFFDRTSEDFNGEVNQIQYYMKDIENITISNNDITLIGGLQALGMIIYSNWRDCRYASIRNNKFNLRSWMWRDPTVNEQPDLMKVLATFQTGPLVHGIRVSIDPLRLFWFEVDHNEFILESNGGTDFSAASFGTFAQLQGAYRQDQDNVSDIPEVFREFPERICLNCSFHHNRVRMKKTHNDVVEAFGAGIKGECLNGCPDYGTLRVFANDIQVDYVDGSRFPINTFACFAFASTIFTDSITLLSYENNICRMSGTGFVGSGVSIITTSNIDADNIMTTFRADFFPGRLRNLQNIQISNNIFDLRNEGGGVSTLTVIGSGVTEIGNIFLNNNIVNLNRYFTTRSAEFISNRIAGNIAAHISLHPPFGYIETIPVGTKSGFDSLISNITVVNDTVIGESTGVSFLISRCGFFSNGTISVEGSRFSGSATSTTMSIDEVKQETPAIMNFDSSKASANASYQVDSSALPSRIHLVHIRTSNFTIENAHCHEIVEDSQFTTNKKLSLVNILPLPQTTRSPKDVFGKFIINSVSFTQDCSFTASNLLERLSPSSVDSMNTLLNFPFDNDRESPSSSSPFNINITKLSVISKPQGKFFFSSESNSAIFGTSSLSSSSQQVVKASTESGSSITIDCAKWNGDDLTRKSFSVKSAHLYAQNSSIRSCSGFLSSLTNTRDRTFSLTKMISDSLSTSQNTQSSSFLEIPEDVSVDSVEDAVAVAQTAALLANFASPNPSLVLSVARGAVLHRVGACYMSRKDLTSAELEYKFGNNTEKVLRSKLLFPLSIFPGTAVGSNPLGEYHRGSLLIFIVFSVVFVLGTALFGSVRKSVWKKVNKKYALQQESSSEYDHSNNADFFTAFSNNDEDDHQQSSLMKNNDKNRSSKKKSKKNKISLNQEEKFNTSVFRHVPIDRLIILPLVIILPFWAEVAGGLLHTQPAGAGDGVLAMLPLSIIIVFFIAVARTLFNFVSSKKKNGQRRQSTSSSKNRSHRKSNDDRDDDEEDEDENSKTVPRFYCEPSDLYTSKTLNSSSSSKESPNNTNFQQSCRGFLRNAVGRFFIIGDVCWNNPTLRYDPATQSIASVPMPSLFSMFLMTFNSYQGPEKIIIKKKPVTSNNRRSSREHSRRRSSNNNLDDFEGFEFTRYDHELLGSPPSSSLSPSSKKKHRSNRHSPSSSRRKSLDYHDQQHHHHAHQLTLNQSFTVRGMSMSMSLSSSHHLVPPSPTSKKKTNSSSSATRKRNSINTLLFPSTPPAAANNNSRNLLADVLDEEIASEKVHFDFSLRRRLQIVWLPFTVMLTLIVCLLGGVSTVDKSKCFDVFFAVLILCTINFFVLLYLRPYITPVKTVISASIDFFTVIGGIILLSCVTSAKTREELDSLIAAGQWLCTLPGSILGVFTLLSGASRTISLLICKSQVAPQSLLRSRIRSELDELEQELLPVLINRSLSLGSSSSFVPAASSSSFSPGTSKSKEEYCNRSQTVTPSVAANGSGSLYRPSRKSPNNNNDNSKNATTSSSLTKSSSFRQPQGFLKDLF